LSLLIIEEEHSNNYKMLRTPHFDIRRFGIEIFNKFKNLTLLFSSSVPSVESVYLNQKGYIKKFSSRKINLKANFKIVDINYSEIIEFLKDNISLKEKSLILVNRTGLASFLKCRDCNTEIECPRCKIPLKVFKDNYLRCQICGKKYEYPTKCPKCEGKLISFGFGVEKIKENLNKIFPNKVSYLIETDKNTPVKLTTTINDKDLIIPKFDKVINIYPDIFLRNSYKADEEFFRNIYLSYIKAKKEFILLTKYKEHSAIKYIAENKIENFYIEELEKRKLLEYPPFVNYILLIFEKRNLYLEDVEELFNNWIKKFNIENIDYEGVYFSNIPYARERYRYSILLKNFKEKSYLKELFNMANKKGIKLTIDVSPRKI
jgi:primosomal protein N' (replication factor Y)